jgi:dolichol-phosphate mannosyltransferase
MAMNFYVIPVYNEAKCLHDLVSRLFSLEKIIDDSIEYIFVNDGSKDESLEILQSFEKNKSNFKYVSFSRNFGHEAATTAGIDYATGDAIVIIDADLQDPPELIPELIRKWREGYHIVYAQRKKRMAKIC